MLKIILMSMLIAGLVPAQVAVAGCWECEDTQEYPWVDCASVSISDIGKTGCQVEVNPNSLNRCVFSGQTCEWQSPPPSTHPQVPPQQGCSGASLSKGPRIEELVTPNGQVTTDWVPRAPASATAAG
jgi:hypothetical protein